MKSQKQVLEALACSSKELQVVIGHRLPNGASITAVRKVLAWVIDDGKA